jgi:hypothetical protein
MKDAYALITGASRGIGKALAFELAAKGYSLILVARSENDLKAVADQLLAFNDIKVLYFVADLADAAAPQQLFQFCEENKLPVTILINNAGYAVWGEFEQSSWLAQQTMIQVNLNAVAEICHLFIPVLKRQKKAWLMNVSSSTQYQPVPYMSAYAAAKGFILLFTRGLKIELKNTAISVSCLVPGTTDTGFIDRAAMSDSIRKKAKQVEMTPEQVAKIAIKGMFNGKAEIIPGFINWISAMASYVLPKSVTENIAASIYRPQN